MSEIVDFDELVKASGFTLRASDMPVRLRDIPPALLDVALLTYDEVAALLGCDRSTVEVVARERVLRVRKFRSLSRVTVADLRDYVEALPVK